VELLGSSPIPRSFVASCVSFQLRPLPSTGVTRYALQRVTGITLGVLLRRASQPSNRLSRFLAERSAGFVNGTTPHNHGVFLEPKHIGRTSVDGGEKQQQPIRRRRCKTL
jgi:hypothetical protein